MKVCAHCGELFSEGKLVCPHCGADADLTLSEAPYHFESDDPRMDDSAYDDFIAAEGLGEPENKDDTGKGGGGGCALLALAIAGSLWLFLL